MDWDGLVQGCRLLLGLISTHTPSSPGYRVGMV